MSLDLVVCPSTECIGNCYHSKPHKKVNACGTTCSIRSYAPCKNVIKVAKTNKNKNLGKKERRFYF